MTEGILSHDEVMFRLDILEMERGELQARSKGKPTES
jgi:hypothetical protein